MRVGLIGCGLAGELHMPAIKKYQGAKVLGAADLDQNRLTAFCDRHDISGRFKNFEEMIAQVKPDVVHVLTPPPTHEAITKKVLEFGCPALVEKPMCMDEAEADRMIEASRTYGIPICCMHNHNFDPAISKADALLKSIPGNNPFLIRITYFIEHHKLKKEGNLDPNHWIHKLPLGIYGEHGAPHVLYLLLKWVKKATDISISEMFVDCSKGGRTQLWNLGVATKDCMGVINLGNNTTVGQFVIEIFTPLIVIRLNMLDLTWTIYRERQLGITAARMVGNVEESLRSIFSSVSNVAAITTGRLTRRPGHRGLIKAFYDSIRYGKPSPVPPEEGREVVRTMKWIEKKLKMQRTKDSNQLMTEKVRQ